MLTLVQFIIVMGCILLGIKWGGLALGLWGGVGVVIFTFVFGVTPTSPPIDVMLIIFSVCTTVAVMESCGGLTFLVRIAARVIRAKPNIVAVVAPIVSFIMTLCAGTGNVCFAILPVVYEVAYNAGVRPERAMTGTAIAGQIGITACPISAATAALLTLFAQNGYNDIQLSTILAITLPSCFVGVVVGGVVMMFYGKDLDKDEAYQARLKAGLVEAPTPMDDTPLPGTAKLSVAIFLFAIVCIVACGFAPSLRTVAGKAVGMSLIIEMCMLAAGAIICLCCKPNMDAAANSGTMRACIISLAAVFGIAWMADMFVAANRAFLLETFGEIAQAQPWTFAIVLALMVAIIQSQGATTRAVMPLGFAIGLPPLTIIACFPAVNCLFILPIAGPAIAASMFDRTQTTKLAGSWLFNHSFMIPGLVMCGVSVVVAFMIAGIMG